MTMKQLKTSFKGTGYVGFLMLIIILFPSRGNTAFIYDGLTIGGYLKNETAWRTRSPNDAFKSWTQLNLEIDYITPLPGVRFYLNLRPEYDAVFDMTNKGLGGSGRKNRDKLQDNFGRNDDFNPLFREVWLEINKGPVEARLGRQLVVWGRSDGIRLLDIINPFNYREFIVDEDEDYKIPLWMTKFTYWFNPDNGLELLWIPRYVPNFNAPPESPWAFQATIFVENTLVPTLKLFGNNVKHREPGTNIRNSELGVRWRGQYRALSYSLNYFYTWDDVLDLRQTGRRTYSFKPDRLHIFGGSFDYSFDKFLGMTAWVFRGEFAYFKADNYLTTDNRLVERDHFETLWGFDKYFFKDVYVSLQYAQSFIIHPSHDEYLGAALEKLDNVQHTFTFMAMKDLLAADKLHLDVLGAFTDDGEGWVRPRIAYDFNDHIKGTIGTNYFWGGTNQGFFGQMTKSRQVFVEMRYGF